MIRHARKQLDLRLPDRAGRPTGRGRRTTADRRRLLALGIAALTTVSTVVGGEIALSSTASAGEAVGNGTFETGTSGWVATPKDDGSAPAALARVAGGHTGSYAARVSNTSSSTTTTVLNDSPNSVASTAAGTTYRATAWVRASQPQTSLVLRLLQFDSGNNLQASKQSSYWATDTGWHKLTVDLPSTKAGSSIDVNVLAWDLGAGKSFLADDISVAPVTTTASPPPPATSSSSSGVLPAQGTGALFGYYQAGGADPRPMESKIGRKFDLIHHFKDFDAGNMWPNQAMLSQAAEGRTIHVGWEMVSYDGGYDSSIQPAPAATSTDRSGAVQKTWTYKQVTNGSLDRYIDAVATKVKATPSYKYIVDIDPEMDDRPDIGGTAKIRAAAGSRTEYAAAYRHIVDRFRAKGVTNVTWAWTVSGWTATDSSKAWSLQQLWPGPNYVNIIMWDPYNHSASNWRSFGQMVAPFYNAIRGGVLDAVDTSAKKLPLGLAEYGCVDDPRRADWLKSIPSEARKYPAIVSLGYFSSGSWGALHTDATDTAAFGAAGKDAWLHTR